MWFITFIFVSVIALVLVTTLRKGGWRQIENGNFSNRGFNQRVTVFRRGTAWKFCIADPSDRSPPYYSEAYETADLAKAAADAYMIGLNVDIPTKREQRETRLRADAPQILSQSQRKLAEMEKAVAYLKRRKSPTLDDFDRVRARLSRAMFQAIHLRNQLIDGDAPLEMREAAGEIPIKIINLKAEIDRLATERKHPDTGERDRFP